MENKTLITRETELMNLELTKGAINYFQELFTQEITLNRIERVNNGLEDRQLLEIIKEITRDYVYGTIRWPKDWGLPYTTGSTLGSAFDIKINTSQEVGIWPDTFIIQTPYAEITKWDGPEDAEFYRVSFHAIIKNHNRTGIKDHSFFPIPLPIKVSVSFAENVGWERFKNIWLNPYIVSPYREFTKGESAYVLEPFEVSVITIIPSPFGIKGV